jgi:hypothetical protein
MDYVALVGLLVSIFGIGFALGFYIDIFIQFFREL